MFDFFKSVIRFELIHSDNIKGEKVASPEALVNYVIGVNNYLYQQEEQGWVYAEKIKETRKGKSTLFAMKIELPIMEDNPYFDQLLSPFYTKKKLPFEEIVLPEATFLERDKEGGEVPPLSPELKTLMQSGNERLDVDENGDTEIDVEVESDDSTMFMEQQAAKQQEIDELKYKLSLKQQEIEQLKRQEEPTMNEKVEQSEQKEAVSQEIVESVTTEDRPKYPGLSFDSVQSVPSESAISVAEPSLATGDVSDMLELVKQEFSTRLTTFVEEETRKIDAEIKEMDTRHLIEAEVTQKNQLEKKNALEAEQETLQGERQVQLTEENKRHEAALATIERTYADKKVAKEQEITAHYSEKLAEDISTEYKRQTEQLSRILQGKKDELSFKQKQMNEGLKENFTQVLATFNESHERVIEQMEQQKVANQPIDFLAHKKAASE